MNKLNLGRVVGYSAYELAINNGYRGTLAEWLESLRYDHSDEFITLKNQIIDATMGFEGDKSELEELVRNIRTDITKGLSDIETKGNQALTDITGLKTESVSAITTAKSESVNTVNRAKEGAVDEVGDTKNAALRTLSETLAQYRENIKSLAETKEAEMVSNAEDSIDEYVDGKVNAAKQEIEEKKQEAINHIPDVMEMKQDLAQTKSELSESITDIFNSYGMDEETLVNALNSLLGGADGVSLLSDYGISLLSATPVNLCDPSKIEVGYLRDDGSFGSSSKFKVTDYIDISGASTVYAWCKNTDTGRLASCSTSMCFYDSSKDFISFVKLENANPVPSGAVYCRMSISIGNNYEIGIFADTDVTYDTFTSYGSSSPSEPEEPDNPPIDPPYIPPSEPTELGLSRLNGLYVLARELKKYIDNSAPSTDEGLNIRVEQLEALTKYVGGKNLYNKDTMNPQNGKVYASASHGVSSSASYAHTGYIPVEPNTTYTFSCPYRLRYLHYHPDATGYSQIQEINISTVSTRYTFTTPSNCVSVSFDLFAKSHTEEEYNDAINNAQLELGTEQTAYESYVGNALNVDIDKVEKGNAIKALLDIASSLVVSPLHGKTMINFGDSIAYGAGNQTTGGYKSYAHIIADKNAMTFINKAVSGARVTKWDTSTTNLVANQIDEAITTYGATNIDYILMDGGTNDVTSAPVGELVDGYDASGCDETTLLGSLEKHFSKLRSTWMNATICYVIVHNMSSRDFAKQKAYHDAILKACEKWSIAVADVYAEGQLNTNITGMADVYCTDGATHPNGLGYEMFFVPVVERKIM